MHCGWHAGLAAGCCIGVEQSYGPASSSASSSSAGSTYKQRANSGTLVQYTLVLWTVRLLMLLRRGWRTASISATGNRGTMHSSVTISKRWREHCGMWAGQLACSQNHVAALWYARPLRHACCTGLSVDCLCVQQLCCLDKMHCTHTADNVGCVFLLGFVCMHSVSITVTWFARGVSVSCCTQALMLLCCQMHCHVTGCPRPMLAVILSIQFLGPLCKQHTLQNCGIECHVQIVCQPIHRLLLSMALSDDHCTPRMYTAGVFRGTLFVELKQHPSSHILAGAANMLYLASHGLPLAPSPCT